MTLRPAAVRINFASRNYLLQSRIYLGLISGSAAFLITLAIMISSVFSYHRDSAGLSKSVAEISARNEELKPILLEREQFLKDIATMSGLMESRRFSWTLLLTGIEASFPEGVALERVTYNPKDSSLVLDGKAQSAESLRNLIVGMERSESFKEPLLKHQSSEKGAISFTVVSRYHEQKGIGLAQNK